MMNKCFVCKSLKFNFRLAESYEESEKTEIDIICAECGNYNDGFNLEDCDVFVFGKKDIRFDIRDE